MANPIRASPRGVLTLDAVGQWDVWEMKPGGAKPLEQQVHGGRMLDKGQTCKSPRADIPVWSRLGEKIPGISQRDAGPMVQNLQSYRLR